MPQSSRYLGGWLLLFVLWCGACTGAREGAEPSATSQGARLQERQRFYSATYQYHLPQELTHYFDATEVDLEYGRLEPASRYQRHQGVQRYDYDHTEIDLALPLPSPPSQPSPAREERDQERGQEGEESER